MEVEFREARNISKLSQLYRAMQIPAKIVDDPINSLDISAFTLGLRSWHGFILCHRNASKRPCAVRSESLLPLVVKRPGSALRPCVFDDDGSRAGHSQPAIRFAGSAGAGG